MKGGPQGCNYDLPPNDRGSIENYPFFPLRLRTMLLQQWDIQNSVVNYSSGKAEKDISKSETSVPTSVSSCSTDRSVVTSFVADTILKEFSPYRKENTTLHH
jgi:hypothetical protein